MDHLHVIGRVLATVFSVAFAILLFPSIVGVHGIARSAGIVLLGVAFIWIVYFGLGALFRSLYEEGKKDASDDNADFV